MENAVDRILEQDLRVDLVQEPGNLPVLEALLIASEFRPFEFFQFSGGRGGLSSRVDYGTASTAASHDAFPIQICR